MRWVGLCTLALLGCGDSAVEVDPALAALVGSWEATEFRVTSAADTEVSFDLIESGGEFVFTVEPSGQYTAVLVLALQTQTEIGYVRVAGASLTLDPEFPSNIEPTTGTYSVTASRLVVDGGSQFDFNQDGTGEAARIHFDLTRRD